MTEQSTEAPNRGRKLAYSVTLWNAGTNAYQTFYPGDQLPDWALPQVRNPKAFQADDAGDHPSQLVPGRDIPIPGPSQLAHDVDPRFADQPRYTHKNDAVHKGYDIADTQADILWVAPPLLHDHVAAHAGDQGADYTSEGREQTHKVRTGQVMSEADREMLAARERDVSDAARGDAIFAQQQREAFEQQQAAQQAQTAQALGLQVQMAHTIADTSRENFEQGQAEQSAAASQHTSGAGFTPSPVLQSPLAPTPGVNIAGMLGVNVPPVSTGAAPPLPDEDDEDDGDETVAELRERLKAKGLSTTGKKAELQERLRSAE
jgi:hypothetical protein